MYRTPVRSVLTVVFASIAFVTAASGIAVAQKKYDPGATDSEIKIGNIVPYSGPVSAYGVFGKVQEAYFRKVNDEGGVRGRKIKYVSYDDAYSPPKAIEQVRKLVESDEVLLVLTPLGTPSNSAIHRYMNSKKVPQLFIVSGATKFADPKSFPWTMGWGPSYDIEGRVYAKYILQNHPAGKVGVLYQNDDYGKDLLKGLIDGLGAKASMIVATSSYETSEPTVDSHVVKLRAAGVDLLVSMSTPKFVTMPYLMAKTFVRVLEQAGDDLTRENIMRQAANLRDLELGLLIDGIKVNTSADDFHPLKQFKMMKFTGESWQLFGPVVGVESDR